MARGRLSYSRLRPGTQLVRSGLKIRGRGSLPIWPSSPPTDFHTSKDWHVGETCLFGDDREGIRHHLTVRGRGHRYGEPHFDAVDRRQAGVSAVIGCSSSPRPAFQRVRGVGAGGAPRAGGRRDSRSAAVLTAADPRGNRELASTGDGARIRAWGRPPRGESNPHGADVLRAHGRVADSLAAVIVERPVPESASSCCSTRWSSSARSSTGSPEVSAGRVPPDPSRTCGVQNRSHVARVSTASRVTGGFGIDDKRLGRARSRGVREPVRFEGRCDPARAAFVAAWNERPASPDGARREGKVPAAWRGPDSLYRAHDRQHAARATRVSIAGARRRL